MLKFRTGAADKQTGSSASMKILYIADDRAAAGLAARALSGLAPNPSLTWARNFDSALNWVDANRDAAALIVEAVVQAQPCTPFVQQVRERSLTLPVVVVLRRGEQVLPALHAGADGYVPAGESLETDLRRVVTAVTERERARQDAFARKLTDVEAARNQEAEEKRQQAERDHDTAIAAMSARLAEIEGRHSAALARESRISTALQQRLLDLETALRNAEERRAANAVASADHLAKLHAEFTRSLSQAAQWRDTLGTKLAEATAALDRAQQDRKTEAAAAAEHLARREAELGAQLAAAVAARAVLERALADAEAAHRETQQRTAGDLAAASERQAALEDLLTQESDRRTMLDQRLAGVEGALQEAERRYAAEQTTAAMRLADLQARYDATQATLTAARAAFEQQIAEAAAARQQIEARAAAEMNAAAGREADLVARLASESEIRTGVETALQEAERRYAAEQATAVTRLADLQAQHDAAQAMLTAARAAFEQQMAEADATRQEIENRAAAEHDAAAEREADLVARLTSEAEQRAALEDALQEAERQYAAEQATAAVRLAELQAEYDAARATLTDARAAFEQQIADALDARQQIETRAAADLDAASTREADLAARLTSECETRAALEGDLATSRVEGARSRRRLLNVASAHRRRARELKARLDAQIASERTDAERQLRGKDEEIQELRAEGARLEALLARSDEALQSVRATLQEERETNDRARAIGQSEFQRLSAEHDQLQHSLAQLQESFDTLEQVAREHALERARLEGVVYERDSQLSAESARHLAKEQAAQEALAQLQERLRHAVETGNAEIGRLQAAIDQRQRELDAARGEIGALRPDAEQVPGLRRQLDASQNERRRQFERAPFGLCRCTADGVILEANHSLASLLGRRRGDELRQMNFAAAVFDRAGDLGWIIERARTTRKTEMVETAWKTKDGRRLLVRVQALCTTDGAIEIVVEDVTHVRALEERLRQGERMEAVGRLAAEVSVTCDALLRDVIRDGREWLAAFGSENPLRHRGELLLTEVTRAASFLRQLGVYGAQQGSAAQPVSVQHVVRNLAPVLKRVVGDAIELVLPKASGSFDVDVDAERLERVLVTLAGYARDRMPDGGQVRIDLASTVVGRRFVAAHPHVRPGPHVVITVAEMRRAAPGDERRSAEHSASEKPGMDLRALADIIGQSGGHLWMEAEPGGNMVVKIHLPSRPGSEVESDGREGRAGRFARWFRNPSTPVGS